MIDVAPSALNTYEEAPLPGPCSDSEPLPQAHVNESSGRIVKEIRVVRSRERIGRIMSKYVIATERDSGAVQKPLPARQSETCCLCRRVFNRFAITNRSCVLGVAGHGRGFDRRSKNKIVGSLNVKEPGLLHVMLMFEIRKVRNIADRAKFHGTHPDSGPLLTRRTRDRPNQGGNSLSTSNTIRRRETRGYTAAQFDLGIGGQFGELERIQISRLCKRGESTGLRLDLVLDTKIGAARLL